MPGISLEPGDICLYVTEGCNSNCIMCPMSEASRKRARSFTAADWESAIEEIPEDVSHFTITGGEPFLQYQNLIPFLQKLTAEYPDVPVLILTNGRALSVQWIQNELIPILTEKFHCAVPIHDYMPESHDKISQTPGSFQQTWKGLPF